MRLARFICVVVAIVVINNVYCFGQIPDGYYDPAIGKTGVDLQLSLYGLLVIILRLAIHQASGMRFTRLM